MSARILIVEDNPANMKLARLFLEQGGYLVIEAGNAEDGISLAREHLPELVLMDIQLPGMDGLTATRILKEAATTRQLKIVALTAFAMKGDEQRMIAAGCDGYIAKPIRFKQFLEEIQRFLALPSPPTIGVSTMAPQKKIIVTDDDPRSRKLVEALLQHSGHAVVGVASGQAALDAVAAHIPDLILLDLMMPGMDGFEVVRRLKAEPATAAIPIIMVTAIDDSASRIRLKAAGVADMITKPIDRWALQTCVNKLLGDGHGNQ